MWGIIYRTHESGAPMANKKKKMGRPLKGKEPRVRVNISLDPANHQKVKDAGENLSELINAYLKRWKPTK